MTVYMFTFVLILCIILAQRCVVRMITIEKANDPSGILLTKTAIEASISKHSLKSAATESIFVLAKAYVSCSKNINKFMIEFCCVAIYNFINR